MAEEKQQPPMAPPGRPILIAIDPESIEALQQPQLSAPCPTWIRRLPLTLPLTHALLTVPSALFGAQSLSEAVLIAAFWSFILFSIATAGIAKATRRSEAARAVAARALAVAATSTILWPLIALLVLGPATHHTHRCRMMGSKLHHIHRHHGGPNRHHARPTVVQEMVTARPFHVINGQAVVATPAREGEATVIHGGSDASPAAVVFSSKGSRVLVSSGPDAVDHLHAAVAALAAGAEKVEHVAEAVAEKVGDRVIISSKGIKALVADDDVALAEDVTLDGQL